MTRNKSALLALLACSTSLYFEPAWGLPRGETAEEIELAFLFRQSRWERCLRDHSYFYCARQVLTGKLGRSRSVPAPPEPPPMPPPPPPPSCPVDDVSIIFFDRGSTWIMPSAAAILDRVAFGHTQGSQCGPVLTVSGHTDRAEPNDVQLAQSRAAAVAAYLAGRGVPQSLIETRSFGETRPLVPTADGVSEPQNRRVEITFGPGSGW